MPRTSRTRTAPDPRTPYNELPRLPPTVELETKAVLKQCVASRAALAELRLAGQLIPNQSVLVSTIPRLEARDSSAIENIVTTNDALFREASLKDAASDQTAKEVNRYPAALFLGVESLKTRPVTNRTAIDICRTLTGIDIDVRATPGTTLSNQHSGEVIYTPPAGQERIRELLANWEWFLNTDVELDPLVRMAVLHYQFEAIHPFPDGNGRTGRVLNILMLMQAGLLDAPTLYLSRHILRTRADYYRLLDGVTKHGAWEAWVLYVLQAVEATASWTVAKIGAIRKLMDVTRDHVRAGAPKIYSHELVDLIFTETYCRIGNLVEHGIAKRQAASTYLKRLAALGILVEEKVGRDKVFIHRKYLDLLGQDDHEVEGYGKGVGSL